MKTYINISDKNCNEPSRSLQEQRVGGGVGVGVVGRGNRGGVPMAHRTGRRSRPWSYSSPLLKWNSFSPIDNREHPHLQVE
jgi:hypothetical protein